MLALAQSKVQEVSDQESWTQYVPGAGGHFNRPLFRKEHRKSTWTLLRPEKRYTIFRPVDGV